MRTVGIICEYNPFHTGHKRQIDILRSMGYDCIVCVMSGNYTQRGELAIFDKYTRAKTAIMCDADVVVELPFPFSSLSAEGFANAGVHILASLGVEAISFGSECADTNTLERAAEALLNPEFKETYAEIQKSGMGSTAAYFEALKKFTGNECELLSNDILGISYLAAIKKAGIKMTVVPIKREGADYNEKNLSHGVLPSASAIRHAMACSGGNPKDTFKGFVPEDAVSTLLDSISNGRAPVILNNIGESIVSFFRLMTPDEIVSRTVLRSSGGKHVAEDGCGICERICHAASNAKTFEDFIMRSYTSKYPNARINRVILFALLGVSDKIANTLPEYTTLLAASSNGRAFLSQARKQCDFTIVTKPADAPSGSIQRKITEAADILYSSAFPSDTECDLFVKSHPFMLK